MHILVYDLGRQLVERLVDAWPAPLCDATDGARLYLAHSCVSCGKIVWPEDDLAPLTLNRTMCENCRLPHVLTFMEGELLISTLQELVFAWPDGVYSATVDQAITYLEAHSLSASQDPSSH